MKLLITAYSDMGMGGFRQKAVETDCERIEYYLQSNTVNEILKGMRFPEIIVETFKSSCSNNIIPNFVSTVENTFEFSLRVRIKSTNEVAKIELLIQNLDDINSAFKGAQEDEN